MQPSSRAPPPRHTTDSSIDQERDAKHCLQTDSQNTTTRVHFDTTTVQRDENYSERFDDDGHLRTGTFWTTTSHIITAVIGAGVLSLSWSVAQLGWIIGPSVIALFSLVNYLASILLCQCYRSGDSASGARNCTYMDAVKSILGGRKAVICGFIQYLYLAGLTIGYTIAASVSMMAIKRSNCFHRSGGKDPCHMSANWYMIAFGITEVIFSQIPDFDRIWWLSLVAAIMSFTYSTVGHNLGIAQVAENGQFKGSLKGIGIGTVTQSGTVTLTQKLWRSMQALGAIAFAFNFCSLLIEIQDTIRSPPAEYKTMKKATFWSIAATTLFYMLCGCTGYAAFGDLAPGNLVTGFGFYNPYWLLNIANLAVFIHLIGAYQVCFQPLFAFVEKLSSKKWPKSQFITEEHRIPLPFGGVYQINLFRLLWRTCFVATTTLIAMVLPFFTDVVAFLGALGFWPLTDYFPMEMYLKQKKIGRWTRTWLGLQLLSMASLVVSIVAAVGAIRGVVLDTKTYKPFRTTY